MQLTGISLAITNILGGRLNPLSWFGAGEQGAWYDPSDITTLFQDSAGNTPVTAVEQPVGLMKDKSGRGNHAFQTLDAKRPVLSAGVNLLTKTEDFSDAVWTKRGTCVATANAGIAPDGTNTATLMAEIRASGIGDFFNSNYTSISGVAGTNMSPSFYIKRVSTAGVLNIANPPSELYGSWVLNLALLSNGWERITNVHPAVTVISAFVIPPTGIGCGIFIYSPPGPSSFYIWGADLRPTNAGALLPPYQRVNTASDYDTVGFPLYLKCNGTSSTMYTNSIDFTATDKMTVVTGVRKVVDQNNAVLMESSLIMSPGYPGSFVIHSPLGTSANYTASCIGNSSAVASTIAYSYLAPITNVLTTLDDIGATTPNEIRLKVNGVFTGTQNGDTGSGNFGNYQFYLFARSGTSLFFNGNFYGAIIRGAASDTASVTQTENYMAQKTGITF